MQFLNFIELLLLSTILLFLILILFLFQINKIQKNLNKDLIQSSRSLKAKSERLRNVTKTLTEQPKKMSSSETEHVMNEIRKISTLWKSRRERLSRGMWEKIEIKKEGTEVKAEDEKSKLQREKERLEELIKKTKIKYRTREIDEQAFREIVKDYQKELMEITLRLSELE